MGKLISCSRNPDDLKKSAGTEVIEVRVGKLDIDFDLYMSIVVLLLLLTLLS